MLDSIKLLKEKQKKHLTLYGLDSGEIHMVHNGPTYQISKPLNINAQKGATCFEQLRLFYVGRPLQISHGSKHHLV